MAQNAHFHLLNNMNLNPETLELAKSILREASVKTKPGSGYELRQRTTGLPAICAYIASNRLKANELTRQTAQIASCLRPADFDKAFHTIEAAIGGTRPSSSRIITYQSLCLKYQANAHLLDPLFQQAQRALAIIDGRYNPERMVEVRCGIFFWVFSLWKSEKLQTIEDFVGDNQLSYRTFVAIVTLLNDKCATLKAEIISRAKVAASSPTRPIPSPTRRSPTKRALPTKDSPTKDSPTKKRPKSPEPEVPQSMHSALRELEGRPFPETPTKRRKLGDVRQKPAASTPLKSILRTSPRKGSATSTPSRVKLDVSRPEPEALSDSDTEIDAGPLPALSLSRAQNRLDYGPDAEMNAELDGESDVDAVMSDAASFLSTPNTRRAPNKDEPLTVRRFRPVYLDYKQWNILDPRLQSIYAMA